LLEKARAAEVGALGGRCLATGQLRTGDNMQDDFSTLTSRDHWLGWLGDDPGSAVRREIEGILQKQVPSARLEWVRLVGEPEFLTGGRTHPSDPNTMIATRAGLAVAFELKVDSDSAAEQLRGVFSWVVCHLDGDRRDRVYLDRNLDIAWAGEELKLRLYEIDVEEAGLCGKTARWWEFWKR
jgi:hypothetical protein